MEDARFLVHIKTPFLSSAMPYMVSPRDIQKKKNLFRLEMKIKKAICSRGVKNLIRTSDSDRCETLSTFTSNQITLVPYRYLWLRQFYQSCRHLQAGFVYDEPNTKHCHHGAAWIMLVSFGVPQKKVELKFWFLKKSSTRLWVRIQMTYNANVVLIQQRHGDV